MATPYVGSLMLVPFGFAPRGYALCNGQLMSIQQNQALFALLGTTYGGNGIQTFGLPNLQGRVALHAGNGFTLGQLSGSETVTITVPEMPTHIHTLTASSATDEGEALVGMTVGSGGNNKPYAALANSTMSAAAFSLAGASQAHENRSPFLVLNWVIALTGIFPSQS